MEKLGDHQEAESWYREAEQQGDARGALRLGDLLASAGDADGAGEWWRTAADAGIEEAAARRLVPIDKPNGLMTWIITEERTTSELDGDRLHEVCRNLWPVDCQTCGKPLGGRTPSLHVTDLYDRGFASLHHVTCHAPAWSEGVMYSIKGLLTWITLCFVAEIDLDGEFQPTPVFLVNPGLEEVSLANKPQARWQVSTVENQAVFGCTPSGSAPPTKHPPTEGRFVAPSAQLTRNAVAVTVPGTTWTGNIDGSFFRLARQLGGVYVAITTRMLPRWPSPHSRLAAEMELGNLAVRWVSFET
jgi:hypothetical protein